jgi:mRNA interferase HigB
MKVIGKKLLSDFCYKHAEVRKKIQALISELENENWLSLQEMKERYPKVVFISETCLVFKKISDNKYRLIANMNFEMRIIYFIWFGTHGEYDKIEVRRICEGFHTENY